MTRDSLPWTRLPQDPADTRVVVGPDPVSTGWGIHTGPVRRSGRGGSGPGLWSTVSKCLGEWVDEWSRRPWFRGCRRVSTPPFDLTSGGHGRPERHFPLHSDPGLQSVPVDGGNPGPEVPFPESLPGQRVGSLCTRHDLRVPRGVRPPRLGLPGVNRPCTEEDHGGLQVSRGTSAPDAGPVGGGGGGGDGTTLSQDSGVPAPGGFLLKPPEKGEGVRRRCLGGSAEPSPLLRPEPGTSLLRRGDSRLRRGPTPSLPARRGTLAPGRVLKGVCFGRVMCLSGIAGKRLWFKFCSAVLLPSPGRGRRRTE